MLHAISMGIVQGITEWIPISSEGMLVLLQTNILNASLSVREMVSVALFLHLGTVLAAVVYYRSQIGGLMKAMFYPRRASVEEKETFWFLVIATASTGVVGLLLVAIIGRAIENITIGQAIITGAIGIFLIVTGLLQVINKQKKSSLQQGRRIPNWKDAIITGIAQGFAIIPGLSRSGLTISTLLLRKIDDEQALSLSFLMSIPAVLAGNIVLNMGDGMWNEEMAVALIVAFFVGLLSIHALLAVAKRVDMGKFVMGFGVVMVCAALLLW